MTGTYVGLDFGRKRIGVAVSTALGTVHPRPRLDRTTEEADLSALKAVAEEAGADAFVVGLPHHMDGRTSGMEQEARAFAAELARTSGLPVYGSDERLTTEAVETVFRNRQVHWRKAKERRDSAAACMVLQDFLHAGEKGERIA